MSFGVCKVIRCGGKKKRLKHFLKKLRKQVARSKFGLTASIPFFEKKPRLLYIYLLAVESPHL